MFAVLQVSDKNTFLRKPEIKSQRYNLPEGDAFFTVSTDKHSGKIPWKKLRSCLGILRKDILISEDITIPESINITPFIPDILPRLLLMNSATDYIMNNHWAFTGKSLIVFDEKAVYTNHIEKLVSFFSSIKIITPHKDKYEVLSESLMKDYGFSLVLSSKKTFDSSVIISDECNLPLYFDGMVFTNEKRYLMSAQVFHGSEIELESEYESLRPENIGRVLFASALYEKCGEKALGNLCYKDFDS